MDKIAGYIEVEMGGKVRPIKFGMGAWSIYEELTGVPITRMIEVPALKSEAVIIYSGLKQAALVKDIEIDFTLPLVYDWIDETPAEVMSDILDTLKKSKMHGSTLEEVIQAMSKKKVNQRK